MADTLGVRPARSAAPPAVQDPGGRGTRSTISLLAKLDKEGLKPAPEADKATPIRRARWM